MSGVGLRTTLSQLQCCGKWTEFRAANIGFDLPVLLVALLYPQADFWHIAVAHTAALRHSMLLIPHYLSTWLSPFHTASTMHLSLVELTGAY